VFLMASAHKYDEVSSEVGQSRKGPVEGSVEVGTIGDGGKHPIMEARGFLEVKEMSENVKPHQVWATRLARVKSTAGLVTFR